MSGLSELLDGRRAPGAYTWAAPFGVDEVRGSVEQAGWHLDLLDGRDRRDKTAVLAGLADALDLPAWFGHNYDALADCLADVGSAGTGGRGTLLLWDGWAGFARADPEGFATVLGILTERTADRPAFAVLLRGDGPELDLPLLG